MSDGFDFSRSARSSKFGGRHGPGRCNMFLDAPHAVQYCVGPVPHIISSRGPLTRLFLGCRHALNRRTIRWTEPRGAVSVASKVAGAWSVISVVRRLHIMNIIDHLDLIDRLVSEKAAPSEIRGHVLAIREQIEAYQKEAEGRELEE